MTETINLPIGPGATIDGARFDNCEVVRTNFWNDGKVELYVEPQNDPQRRFTVSLASAQSALDSEIRDNQPVNISGSDLETNGWERIELPLVAGASVVVYKLGVEYVWDGEQFRTPPPDEEPVPRGYISHKLHRFGGIYTTD